MEHLDHPSLQFHWCQIGALLLLRAFDIALGEGVNCSFFILSKIADLGKVILYINHVSHLDLTHWMVIIFIFDCMTVQTNNTIIVWQISKAKWTIKLLVWRTNSQGEGAPIWKGGRCSLEILKEISLRDAKIWSLGVAWFFFLDLPPWAGPTRIPDLSILVSSVSLLWDKWSIFFWSWFAI